MATPSVSQAQETTPGAPQHAAPQNTRRAARKAAFAAAVSTSLEWYDFFIYATAAALVFNKTFFATGSEVVAALNSFATVAVGFVARPIGGIVSGHFGDKYGRKPVLVTAILLMGVATTLIGFVPNTSITWLAPAMLVLLRICQGLAVGAQWGGAVLLATEYAPADRRGFYGSFAQLGIPIGVVMGNAVFLAVAWAVSPEAFTSWGWRVPFWISLFMLFVAFAIHRYLEETPEFQQVEAKLAAAPAQRRSPVLEVLRHNSGTVLMAGGTYLVGIVMFYITITGSVQVATTNLGIARSDVLAIILIAAGVLVPMVPLTAYLSDRYGRKLIYGIGIVGMGLWAVPMWLLIGASSSGDILPLAVALIVSCVVMSFQTGPQAALFAELFPPEIRYSGASLGYQAAAILGGMAPMAMVALINGEVANLWRVGLLIAALSVLALACLVALARRRP
ncbi:MULTISPECIES: MFS transporter [Rhodococcus]|uniref:MFS transporter n=3 Tax=Rhodococcus TaxID=1827 RepID=M2Z768_9NOCA|nr:MULTISPECIES: MFS transporter [Rhodococcus]EME63087.1 MFS transporter [Rhodococcus ruber BKS 20-38]KOS53586.1 MFS transporter [Rhodococcus rhodochrous KG-21]MDM7489622.1 MFS transporter [Rhodococcus indonesiensis]